MGRPKVRADARDVIVKLAAHGIALDQLPPGPDGWHSRYSIMSALRRTRTTAAANVARPPAPRPVGPWGANHPVDWAYNEGKITSASMSAWRERYVADPDDTAATLELMAPVLDPPANVVRRRPMPVVSATPPRAGYAYSNPVEELRQNHATAVARAEAAEPAPELFPGSGDYPRATASGIEPAALVPLPWRARLAASWTGDRSEAFRITQDFGGPEGAYLAAFSLGNNPAVKQAITAALAWFGTAGIEDDGTGAELTEEEYADFFGRTGRPPRTIQRSGE